MTRNDTLVAPVLEARGITKAFAGIKALDDVNLQILPGEINAIVGENGAGKSTLMKVLSGVYKEYEGSIILDNKPVKFNNTREAQDKGLAIIHQDLNLIPYLSIAENIFLGREFLTRTGLIDYKKMHAETMILLKRLEFDIKPDTLVTSLRVGQQQVVEIAKVLSLDARIIIMDEPTSAISEREIYVLFELVKNLTKKNVAIAYITHKLDELFKIADSVTVLRDGKCVASRRIEEVDHDDVVRMMVGRDLNNYYIKAEAVTSKPAMSAKNLSLAYPDRSSDFLLNNVEFSVHKGEVLGIFGLMGAGRTELFETIFGLHPETSSGQIILDGEEISIKSPGEAIRAGIGLVPEDRKLNGLVLNMAVQANITLASLRESVRMALISQKREKEIAEELIKQLQIKTPSPNEIVKNLSGGNQQKVIIAKWLATKPKILLLDEPTRGVDVNAKNEIYRLISELIKQKLAIIMISSELREILAISDRIMVLSEGRKTAEFVQEKANQEKIMNAAIPRSM